LYKVSAIEQDTTEAAKARHILVKPADESEEAEAEAKAKAEGILRQLKNGADFAQIALENSDDTSNKTTGGDLGWFSTGRMVPEFQEAAFGATQPGLLNKVVETQFGYHIIDVQEPKTNDLYKVATILREITPSQETREIAYRKAEFFRSDSPNLEQFEATGQKDSVDLYDAPKIDKNARNVNTLSDAREVVRWLYNNASKGKVSEVFELDDQYVVAVMTGEEEEGTAKLDDVREELTVKTKYQKKGELIKQQLSELSGSLEEIASAFGTDANVYSASDLKLSSSSLANVGNAPLAVGRAFSLKPSARSQAIVEDNGVLIVELISIIEAPEVADYGQYKQQIRQTAENRDGFSIGNAIREHSNIVDERYKSY
ncbi:MAG: peptidylprolyl isomerase, partial [Cyclobacteriaceae bacterium]